MKFNNIYITLEKNMFNDLEKKIETHNLHFAPDDENKIKRDKAVFLLDQISYQKSIRKDAVCKNGFIRIPSVILNAYLKKQLKLYKEFLIKNNFIQVKPYSKNRSYGYRISYFDNSLKAETKNKEYVLYEFLSKTYLDFISKSTEKLAKIEKKKSSAERTTKHLTRWINKENIKVDWKSAFEFINSDNSFSLEQKNQFSYSVNRIRFNQWYYNRSTKDNRLHTNLTNLSSKLRKFLNHKGSKLVSLDIKSSQPYFLAGVFNLYLENKTKRIEYIKKGIRSKEVKDKLTTVMNSITLTPSIIIDFRTYINLVCNNDLYLHLAANLDPIFIKSIKTKKGYSDKVFDSSSGIKIDKSFKSLRIYCKFLVFEYMYCSIRNAAKRLKEVKRFYPTAVNKFIYDFKYCKEVDITKGKKKKKRTKREREKIDRSKKLFSKFLQQLEAFIILDVITKELSQLYPKMFIATIHDSIIVTKRNENVAKDYIQKRLFEILGVRAIVESEVWEL